MVAVRRIKHLVQLSAVGLLVLTFVIFIQWDEISYGSRLKRQVNDFREQLEYSPDLELLELERELDVDRILKKIHEEVTLRLMREEEDCYKRRKGTISTNSHVHLNNESENSNVNSIKTTTNAEHQNKATFSPSAKKSSSQSRDKEHRRHTKQFRWKRFPWKPDMRGQLNVHIWQAWCGNTIHDLRRNWFFPSYPDLHLTVSRFFVRHYEDDYGQRIFGYIHPPVTGKYVFALSSDDASELWLSKDELPENVRLLAWVGNRTSLYGYHKTSIAEFTKYKTQLSKQVFLKKGRRYYVEALHKQGAREDHILVGWKVPGLSRFRYISGDSISMYIDDRYASTDVTEYAKFIPQTLPCHTHSHAWSVVLNQDIHKFGSNNVPNEFRPHQLVEVKDLENILPNCIYEPSYIVNFTLKRYEGVKLIHDSAVYPDDFTLLTHMIPYDKCQGRRTTDSHGNSLNLTIPALSNHSLFDEGKIKVFGLDGKGSVITTPSDLEEDYLNERVLKADDFNSTFRGNQSLSLANKFSEVTKEESAISKSIPLQSQNQVVIVDKEMNRLLNGIRKHPVPLQNQIVKGKDLKPKGASGKRIHDSVKNDRIYNADKQLEAAHKLSKFRQDEKRDAKSASKLKKKLKPSQQEQNIQNSFKRRLNKNQTQVHSNVNLKRKNKSQKLMVQSNSRNVNNVENTPKRTSRIVHEKDKLPRTSGIKRSVSGNVNQRTSSIDRNVQRELPRSYSEKTTMQSDYQPDKQTPRRFIQNNQYVQGNIQPKRKLLYYPTDQNDNDDDDEEDTVCLAICLKDAQLPIAKNTHDAVSRLYFRPIGTIAYNHNISNFLFEDRRLTRLNSAREYVRRMQTVIQIYQHPMSGRQISDQIYRRYGIRMRIPEMKPYLNYNPLLYHHNTTKCASDGNLLLNENVAKSVVARYMKKLTQKTHTKYSLQRIINVQENHDVMYGDRYLMELELLDKSENKSVRLSQYLYQKSGQPNLCLPHKFQINHHATVHVIVPVKNQGRWVQYFIDDMSEIYLKTRDPHLNVIIVDFSSDDIDVEEALRRSALVRYKVITLSGPFQRAFGIQAGSTAVKNPNDIIFMCDLHLELPNNMIGIIRKHCIQGKMAFAPVVTRLHCGFTPSVPFGFWELQGYGLFAMYKSDFTRVGGMNYKEFGTRWGGEDWELLDRVLLKKMEVERLRIPNFYHFYHSKKGMWGSPTTDSVMSDITEYYNSKNQIIPLYSRKIVNISPSRRPLGPDANTHRQLRIKRKPSRAVRPPSRLRRGYRPRKRQKPVEIEIEREY